MSKITAALLLSGAMALTSTTALAGGWRGSHPRRAEVNGRLENQHDRIHAGVQDGQLTHHEAHQLRAEDHSIRVEERSMAHLDGGHITRADQRSLNQQENAVSRQIYNERH